MSKYLSSLLGSQNIKKILGTNVSDIKSISGIDVLNLPLGTIIMYHGTGINDPSNKTTQISVSNGDSFDMLGWYVCNGKTISDYGLGNATDLVDKFLRMEMEAGNTGGNNDAPYIAHSHTLESAGGHTHSTGNESSRHRHSYCDYWGTGAGGLPGGAFHELYTEKTTTSKGHTHSTNSESAHSNHSISNSGSTEYVDKNIPYSRTLIFLERKRKDNYKMPSGAILMYHGTAIEDIDGKGSDLSSELGMPNWYVANGVKAGTVNMVDRFAFSRTTVATGSSVGSNNVTLRQHSHTCNSGGSHSHTSDNKSHTHGFPGYLITALYYVSNGGGSWGLNYTPSNANSGDVVLSSAGDHTHPINNASAHYHNISEEGDNNGVGYNIPAYKTLIFIQKVI